MAGLATRFPVHPVCGARTKRGTRCKAPQVAGAKRCRHHGGGRVLLQRARETVKKTRSRSIISKCLWYFEKAHRNRVRQYLKAGERQLAAREAAAEQANKFIASAAREGWASRDLINRLHSAAEAARPYRSQDVACAVGAFLSAMSRCEPPPFRFAAFASELQLDEGEQSIAADLVGVHLAAGADRQNANEGIGCELTLRSLKRRALRRQRP